MGENMLTVENRAEMSQGISGGDAFFEFAIRQFRGSLSSDLSVLDLGCGVGGFGRFLEREFGIRATGVDVILHKGFDEKSYRDFQQIDLNRLSAATLPGSWDVVTAIGVIEYLMDPRAFIQAAARLLRKGGRLMITSPNPASARSLVTLLRHGEYSAFKESTNPASITPVLPKDAVRMFREAGLEEIELDYSRHGGIPGLGGTTWQRFFPSLGGRLFSDDFCVTGRAV